MFLVIIVAALGGGIPTFAKMALEVFPTFTFVFLRFVIAALVLMPFIVKKRLQISKKELLHIALISLLGTGNVVFFAFGVKHTSATVSQLLFAVVPIIAVIASMLILKTTISKQKIIGMLLGLVGVIIIILVPAIRSNNNGMGTVVGNILVLTAVTSYALYTVLSKSLQQKFSPLVLTTIMVITTILIQSLLIPTEISKYNDVIGKITFQSIFGLIYVGSVGTALYFLLYQRVIKQANPVTASMIFYLQPIFTFIWSFILLGERLTLSLIIGSVFILIGASVVTRKEAEINVKESELAVE